jgi:HlyD family secretion protein
MIANLMLGDLLRSQLTLAQAALDQTRIRASVSGTVLQVTAKLGEIAIPAEPLIVVGDLTGLQVRAAVEERDIAKIRADARVVVRAHAFPDTGFDGRVTTIPPGLSPTRLSACGPRRPNDTEALEVFATLAGTPPLRPGMRVDVYFYSPEEDAPVGKP